MMLGEIPIYFGHELKCHDHILLGICFISTEETAFI